MPKRKNNKKFEFLEHAADIKFRAYGKTLNEAFENSVAATISYLSDGKISDKKIKIVEIKGNDYESLLYNLLDEILFLLDSEGFIVSRSKIKIDKLGIKAKFYGDDAKKYGLDHIKAPTYFEMYVRKAKKGERIVWEIQAVLDV